MESFHLIVQSCNYHMRENQSVTKSCWNINTCLHKSLIIVSFKNKFLQELEIELK